MKLGYVLVGRKARAAHLKVLRASRPLFKFRGGIAHPVLRPAAA